MRRATTLPWNKVVAQSHRSLFNRRCLHGGRVACSEALNGPAHQKPTAQSRHRIHSTLPTDEIDVAVVGCGSAGLLAGAILANHGLNVHCFDSHYVAGGCATQFGRTVKKGDHRGLYRFDIGLHYIGDVSEFRNMLEPAGISIAAAQNYNQFDSLPRDLFATSADVSQADVVLEQMDPDCYDTLVFPDFDFCMPASHDVFRARLVELFPEEVSGIDKYIRMLQEVDIMQRAMLQASGKGVRGQLGMAWKLASSGRLLAQWRDKPLGPFLHSCTRNPRLLAVLAGQNGDYGLPPSEVSLMLHCGLTNHYLREGAFYPRGGGQAISDALAARIETCGGVVHLRRAVRRIMVEGGTAVGVEVESRGKEPPPQVRARLVISAGDLENTLTKLLSPDAGLDDDSAATIAGKTRGFHNAEGLFMTCLGLDLSPDELRSFGMRSANYWCFDSYDFEQTYADVRSGSRDDAFGCYITSASLKDPHVAHSPPGTTNVEVLTICSPQPEHWGVNEEEAFGAGFKYRRNERYVAKKQALQDGMVRRLDARFPGLADHVVFKESTTPFSHHRFTHGGTAYGLAASADQFMRSRPGLTGPVDGLLMCGHSTRTGHGIAGAMLGGARAARVAEALLKRWGVSARTPRVFGAG